MRVLFQIAYVLVRGVLGLHIFPKFLVLVIFDYGREETEKKEDAYNPMFDGFRYFPLCDRTGGKFVLFFKIVFSNRVKF